MALLRTAFDVENVDEFSFVLQVDVFIERALAVVLSLPYTLNIFMT